MATRKLYLWVLVIAGILIAENTSTISPTSSPSSEPETETEPEQTTNEKGFPEPVPDWPIAFQKWKWAWPLHVYLFGVLYLVVGMTACISLGIEFAIRRLQSNRLKVSFFTQMAIFGITRAILLFIDPYISKRLSNGMPAFVVWSFGMPLMLSTFSLLLFALVDTTRIHLAPPRFQNLLVVSVITVTNLCIVSITNIIVIKYFSTGILVFLCQIYLCTFGLLLCVGFLYVGRKLSQNTNALTRNRMKRLHFLVYTSAAVGMCLVGSEVYSATNVFGVLNDSKEIPPWPWLGLQTCARLIEISMSVIILLSFKRTKTSVQDVSDSTV